jgi:effector-binding domain-containing protein
MKSLNPFLLLLLGVQPALAGEEAPYQVVRQDGAIEIRAYEPRLIAEVLVGGTLEEAGNKAFRTLFRYIDGNNQSKKNIPMTAPVSQEKAGEKWAVGFLMPAAFTMETIPTPNDPAVVLREKPACRMAAIRYRGFWSQKNYEKHLQELEIWIKEQELAATGDPVWARYNPPFTPWFLRRNEILIPVE